MHVLVLFNRVSSLSPAAELDVLQQVLAVENALRGLGHYSTRQSCGLDLDELRAGLIETAPDVVFNLVESLGGTDRLMPLVTVLLDGLGLSCTGSSSLALLLANHKVAAKKKLLAAGLPTPAWMTRQDSDWQGLSNAQPGPDTVIIKAIAEHASFGLSAASLFQPGPGAISDVHQRLAEHSEKLQVPHFAEAFVPGREFNLSLLASDQGAEVLPPAEIEFVDFDSDEPRIVGQEAKWDVHATSYINTPRSFDFAIQDRPLLDELMALARHCWHVFGLRGWARVDFRVDADGQPWILEINANPCLSPDAGFAAAAARAGLSFPDVVSRILADPHGD
jgi:D-alanine-D-alanine ligase